jgi:4-amino-4-deoxy-L-arabinose transferase-like glycosyltransferase
VTQSSSMIPQPTETVPARGRAQEGNAWRRAFCWLDGEPRPRLGALAAWGLLLLLVVVTVAATLTWDHTDIPTTGDENSYMLQALSLAYDGHDLTYDSLDAQRWRDVGFSWMPTPQGFFFRTNSEAYTSAKPYGYPLAIAPFIRVLGFSTGIAVAHSLLFVALVGVSVAILRTRLTGAAVPLLVSAFTFGSAMYLYTYAVSVEIFFALLTAVATLCALRWWRRRTWGWAAPYFVTVGFAAAEKPPLALAMMVPGVVMVLSMPTWRRRLVGLAIVAVAFVVAVTPYLVYSEGTAYTPYAKPRHYSSGTIFDRQSVTEFREALAAKPPTPSVETSPFTPTGLRNTISKAPKDIPVSTWYFLVGRHTGMLLWAPLSLAAICAALWRFRHLDWMGRACLLGILAYIGFYLVLYPTNYYGGAHSLGNRYFLQVAPLALGVLATLGWKTRTAIVVSLSALLLSLIALWPQHSQPRSAYLRIERTSALQELLPLESNQTGAKELGCPGAYGIRLDCRQPVAD